MHTHIHTQIYRKIADLEKVPNYIIMLLRRLETKITLNQLFISYSFIKARKDLKLNSCQEAETGVPLLVLDQPGGYWEFQNEGT